MSTLLARLIELGLKPCPYPYEIPEVSTEESEILGLVFVELGALPAEISLTADHWWELYQIVRKARNAVIRNQTPSSLPFVHLSWMEQRFLLQGPLLGDRSTTGTDMDLVETDGTGNEEDAIILAINITLEGGGQVNSQVPFPLFSNWHWTGSPIDRSWMLSEASLFEATRKGGFTADRLTFDWSNPIQVETWELAMPGIFSHITELLQSFFTAYGKEKAALTDEAGEIGVFKNPSLRFLIGLIEHYRKLGVIQNPEMTMEEKVHLGQILTLPGDGTDPCRNAPELSAGHEAIYQFFRKNVPYFNFEEFKKKEA